MSKIVYVDEKGNLWHDPKEEKPEPFTSVLGYIPSQSPFPVIREVYRINEDSDKYFIPAIGETTEIAAWQDFPEISKIEK